MENVNTEAKQNDELNPQSNHIAEELYTAYSLAVGGVNFKGEPLPSWMEFATDPEKTKQSRAWLVVANHAILLLGR